MQTKSILLLTALLLTVACASKPTDMVPPTTEAANTEKSSENTKSNRTPAGEIAGSWNQDTANYGDSGWGRNSGWGNFDWGQRPTSRQSRYHYSRSYYRRSFPRSRTCSAQGAAEWIVKIGQATHSSHQCLAAVRAAYGGCSARVIDAIHSYQHGMNSMRRAGWRCGYTHNPYEAPEGAVIAEANHVEIRVGRCFYSDFHVVNCKPGTKYSHNPRHMYGWCMP